MHNNFYISPEDTGKRLDKFLVEKLSNMSRSQIQKIIESGNVLVNGKPIKKHYWLDVGDVVEINVPAVGAGFKPASSTDTPINKNITFTVIHETSNYIIIEKPSGIIVHQSPGHPEPDTLVNGLLEKYPEIHHVGSDNYPTLQPRPGIVHRLDKDVSGLMVIARTQKMFDHLKNQFKNRTVKKQYMALVHGIIQKSDGVITFPISRSISDRKKMAGHAVIHDRSVVGPDNYPALQEATTLFEVIQRFERYTFLKIEIKTGRTHQIRVHMNAYAHPIVGDAVYRPKSLKTRVHLGRLFLHACLLGFYDLENNWQEFTSPLPKVLQEFLHTLA